MHPTILHVDRDAVETVETYEPSAQDWEYPRRIIMICYELGPSGKGPRMTCSTLDDLIGVAPHLAPGRYWITSRECGDSADGAAWEEAIDWGVLEVREPSDWKLEGLAGFQAGPGYVVA